MKLKLLLLLLVAHFSITAQIQGCTDQLALNYDSAATIQDGSCLYAASSISPATSISLPTQLNETSGLLMYQSQLISHNDDSDSNLYLFDPTNPTDITPFQIPSVSTNDWEDIAEDDNYIYIGDFGNNAAGNRTNLKIFRIPKSSWTNNPLVDTISYSYDIQTDFTPQAANTTNFDCEAFIVTNDYIYLFTKEWSTGSTRIFKLDKTPGEHVAYYQESLNCNGLITGATHVADKNLVVLSGYTGFLQPFLYLLYDFENDAFFSGNKRLINVTLPFHQIEGIATNDGLLYYVSNERFQSGNTLIEAKIHTFDLSVYLENFFQSETLKLASNESKISMSAYPNPTTQKLFLDIHSTSFEQPIEIEVMDLHGKTVLKKSLNSSQSTYELDLEGIPAGSYQVVYSSNSSGTEIGRLSFVKM